MNNCVGADLVTHRMQLYLAKKLKLLCFRQPLGILVRVPSSHRAIINV